MAPKPVAAPRTGDRLRYVIAAGAVALLALGAVLFAHARSGVNKVALSAAPKGVTVANPKQTTFRASRRYVGTLEPWIEAKVGPQFVSAYVDTVLVRPGAIVKRGDVLATLDCRNASATSKAVTEQAHAVEAMQAAIHHESERLGQLQDGGYVSPNELEQKAAESASRQAQVLALQAQMLGTSLQVSDCVLRAPFDGEIADRSADPGSFVKPGSAIVTLVDRNIVRLTADVPEDDFGSVPPGTPAKIHVVPTRDDLVHPISRRAPAADPGTRTVHIEIDIDDPARRIPVYTTAEIGIDVGEPKPAAQLPLAAVSIRGDKATLYVVKGNQAHKMSVPVLGEAAGSAYLDPSLDARAMVVVQGRTLLHEGDEVAAQLTPDAPRTADASTPEQRATP